MDPTTTKAAAPSSPSPSVRPATAAVARHDATAPTSLHLPEPAELPAVSQPTGLLLAMCPAQLRDKALWSVADLRVLFSCGETKVAAIYGQPGFPRPVELTTSGHAAYEWFAHEVLTWLSQRPRREAPVVRDGRAPAVRRRAQADRGRDRSPHATPHQPSGNLGTVATPRVTATGPVATRAGRPSRAVRSKRIGATS